MTMIKKSSFTKPLTAAPRSEQQTVSRHQAEAQLLKIKIPDREERAAILQQNKMVLQSEV